MGNCIGLEDKKMIKIMTVDGRILSYKPPMDVQHLLSEFPMHAVSEELPLVRQLHPMTKMRRGQLYYLFPSKKTPTTSLSSDKTPGEGAFRIKLVISKQELKSMIEKGGVSIGDMVSLLQTRQAQPRRSLRTQWRHSLDSIHVMRQRGFSFSLLLFPLH